MDPYTVTMGQEQLSRASTPGENEVSASGRGRQKRQTRMLQDQDLVKIRQQRNQKGKTFPAVLAHH